MSTGFMLLVPSVMAHTAAMTIDLVGTSQMLGNDDRWGRLGLKRRCASNDALNPGHLSDDYGHVCRDTPGGFSVRGTLYGKSDREIADRAINCVQREKRLTFPSE